MTVQPLRFSCDIRTLTVTDTQTGEVIQCSSAMHMAEVRRTLELRAMPAKKSTGRRVKEQW